MSIWSAIGLADRKAVESLTEQIENLHKENRELIIENKKLISSQIGENYSKLYSEVNQNTQFLGSKLQEIQKDLCSRTEEMTRQMCQQIKVEGTSTRDNILLTEQRIEADLSEVHMALAKMQEKYQEEIRAAFVSESEQIKERGEGLESALAVEGEISRRTMSQVGNQVDDKLSIAIREQKKETDSVLSSISEVKETILNQNEDVRKQVSMIFEQQQELSSDSCKLIADTNKDLVIKVEQSCASVFEEVKSTEKNYRQMARDEQENLNRIRALSNEMVELGEHQKRVMEQLSILCQDSDQFMEIQKSINDMWEIMKAVWVDSLLNDYEKELNNEV